MLWHSGGVSGMIHKIQDLPINEELRIKNDSEKNLVTLYADKKKITPRIYSKKRLVCV